jgi:hypothetical protein
MSEKYWYPVPEIAAKNRPAAALLVGHIFQRPKSLDGASPSGSRSLATTQ